MREKPALKKFATQVDASLLSELYDLAKEDGKKVQALVGEALKAYVKNRKDGKVRPEVLQAFEFSAIHFGQVYKALVGRE